MTVLNDSIARTLAVLGNRADLNQGIVPRVAAWLRDSYINICMSYQLETLEQSISQIVNSGVNNVAYPPDARAIQSITFYSQQNTTIIQPDFKDLQYFRLFNPVTPGPPSIWTTQNGNILFAPKTDNNYNLIIDYLQLPQITDGMGNILDPRQSAVSINNTPILLPYDWLEVYEYGAELRGHAELLEREKAQEIQQLLFGFTIPLTNKFVPGLIGQIMTRREAQAPLVNYGMQPSGPKRSFTNVGG